MNFSNSQIVEGNFIFPLVIINFFIILNRGVYMLKNTVILSFTSIKV